MVGSMEPVSYTHLLVDPFVMRLNRIHMNHRMDVEFFLQFPLNQVNLIVTFDNVFFGRYLCVQGSKHTPRPIIMDNQVVDSQNAGMFQHYLFDLFYQRRIRRLAKQRIQRIPQRLDACNKNKHRHQRAHISVDIQVENPIDRH